MYSRKNISFQSNDLTLRGWLYQPQNSKNQHPAIIMTHGFSGLKEHGLDRFAEVFAKAGFSVLVFDNRNFGESDGLPRQEVDPEGQVADLSAAITFLSEQPEIDPKKIGLWGTSFSGANVLVAASSDKRVKAVVSQIPYVIGHHEHLKSERPLVFQKIQKRYDDDRASREAGLPPTMIQVVTDDPKKPAVMKDKAAFDVFTSVPGWTNEVTLRSIENSGNYSAIDFIPSIAPTPVLFIVAEEDTVNPTKDALLAFEKASDPKKLIMIKGGHFSAYAEEFVICSEEARAWFETYLK